MSWAEGFSFLIFSQLTFYFSKKGTVFTAPCYITLEVKNLRASNKEAVGNTVGTISEEVNDSTD